METTSPAFLSPFSWQKRPIQVTTTNKDKWQEGFPESPGLLVSVSMDPSSQPFCVAVGEGSGQAQQRRLSLLETWRLCDPSISLITDNGLCPITVQTAPSVGRRQHLVLSLSSRVLMSHCRNNSTILSCDPLILCTDPQALLLSIPLLYLKQYTHSFPSGIKRGRGEASSQ